MRLLILSLILLLFPFPITAQYDEIPFKSYVDFLESSTFQSPVEYLSSSFEEKDILIFSERYHPEFTQYELLVDFMKNSRFKGDVYTEVGVYNMGPAVHDFLKKEGLSKAEKKDLLLELFRDLDYDPIWSNYNYYYLLSSVYDINQDRSAEDKIMVHPLDIVFSWDSMQNHAQYKLLFDMMEPQNDLPPVIHRNAVMARHFIRSYGDAKRNNSNKVKAVVIMNTYHAYTYIPSYRPNPNEPRVYSTGQYIFKSFPEITKGIMINGLGNAGNLAADRKWDAAFETTGNKPLAFDLKDTPFGRTRFDLYRFGGGYEEASFEEILEGFIFYVAVPEQKFMIGIPGIFDDPDFRETYIRRSAISWGMSLEAAKSSKEISSEMEELNEISIPEWLDLDQYRKETSRWIEGKNSE